MRRKTNSYFQHYRLLHCSKGTSDAWGYSVPHGFIVKEGSIISEKISDTFECASKSYLAIRNRLISNGTIVDRHFTCDYTFTSPTAAGAVVTGWTVSGKVAWTEAESSEQETTKERL